MSVAMVTGSSSGIGARTAETLAANGYSVILHAHRNLHGLHATAQRIQTQAKSSGRDVQVLCMTANLADSTARRDLVRAAFAWQGSVSAWINNAGADVLTGDNGKLTFEERLELLWQVDVAGTIHLSRLAAARMQRQRVQTALAGRAGRNDNAPSIVNIGWDQALLGMEGEAGQLFCPTKGAIIAFTRALALSVAPQIRVNCVAPGWIQTSWGAGSASPYWEERAKKEAALERWGRPLDVAEAIAWLVSPRSGFVNGQTLEINGGRRFYPNRSDVACADPLA